MLCDGGLAVVGYRDVGEEEIRYTEKLMEICAKQEIQIFSGGARGVDKAAVLGIIDAGGTAVEVLADSLTKTL